MNKYKLPLRYMKVATFLTSLVITLAIVAALLFNTLQTERLAQIQNVQVVADVPVAYVVTSTPSTLVATLPPAATATAPATAPAAAPATAAATAAATKTVATVTQTAVAAQTKPVAKTRTS